MKLQVRSLPLIDVITDIAKQLKAEITEDCEEYTLILPKKYGSGIIRGVNFNNGMGLIEYYCTFKTQVEIYFTLNRTHPLKFIFCSQGELHHSFAERKEMNLIELHQNVIVASSRDNGHVLFFPKNKTIHMNSLEIKRDEFQDKLDCLPLGIQPSLENLFKDVKAKELFYYHGDYSLAMADCIREINENKEEGFIRKTILEAKALEMLGLQIKTYEDEKLKPKNGRVGLKSEYAPVQKAANYIEQNLHKHFTVKDLARQVGTNTTKLQSGFKKQFNTSVNAFVNDKRMELAKQEIIKRELNIGEIAQKVGLKNKSYFSRLFRERYGANPKEFSQKSKTVD